MTRLSFVIVLGLLELANLGFGIPFGGKCVVLLATLAYKWAHKLLVIYFLSKSPSVPCISVLLLFCLIALIDI